MSNNITSPSKIKRYMLDHASKRAHKFTRVSQLALDKVEAAARSAARHIVDSAPSKGKTL